MDKFTRKKTDFRPKKICRSDGSYWIPNPCINEHYLTQRLKELNKHEEIYKEDHKRRQNEIQRELHNIRASKNTKNGAGYFRKKGKNSDNSKSHDLSLTEIIDKFKMKRVENDLISDLIKQKRNILQYIDESIRERSQSKLWESIVASKSDDIGMIPRKMSNELSILDEMKASLDTARRLSTESSWDEIFDTVRTGRNRNSYPSIQKRNDLDYDKNRKMYRRSKTLHADKIENVAKRLERPKEINGERSSVIQLNFRRRTPTYIEEHPPMQKRRSRKTKRYRSEGKGNCSGLGLTRERTFYPGDIKKQTQNLADAGVNMADTMLRRKKIENKITTDKNTKPINVYKDQKVIDTGVAEDTNEITKPNYLKKHEIEIMRKLNNGGYLDHKETKKNLVQNTFNIPEETKKMVSKIGINKDKKQYESAERLQRETPVNDKENDDEAAEFDFYKNNARGKRGSYEMLKFGGLVQEPEEMMLLPNKNEKETYAQKFEEKLGRIKQEETESVNIVEFDKNECFDECEVQSLTSQETWDDVKRCRYLRGYDPPEMVMPKGEINVFVFGRDENDILELRRQNKKCIIEKLSSAPRTDQIDSDVESK